MPFKTGFDVASRYVYGNSGKRSFTLRTKYLYIPWHLNICRRKTLVDSSYKHNANTPLHFSIITSRRQKAKYCLQKQNLCWKGQGNYNYVQLSPLNLHLKHIANGTSRMTEDIRISKNIIATHLPMPVQKAAVRIINPLSEICIPSDEFSSVWKDNIKLLSQNSWIISKINQTWLFNLSTAEYGIRLLNDRQNKKRRHCLRPWNWRKNKCEFDICCDVINNAQNFL